MKEVVVIGGGFAGLSSAVFLADKGYKVKLFEAAKKLGGRAYSFIDPETSVVIDNGQHIMMGCYSETLRFLDLIGGANQVEIQKNLSINFITRNKDLVQLRGDRFIYPFNLLIGILSYKGLSLPDRLSVVKIFSKLPMIRSDRIRGTVHQWLSGENQSEKAIRDFWEIIAIGTLNSSIYKASARLFCDILKLMFLKGNKAASLVLPLAGLSDIYCTYAERFIEERGGKVVKGNGVAKLDLNENKVNAVVLESGEIERGDYYLSTIPHYALGRIVDMDKMNIKFTPDYSTILSIHVWINENKCNDSFYGLIDSPVHWVFNKGTHLTLVISDANEYNDFNKEEIIKLVKRELDQYLSIKESDIRAIKIIKEKRATFIPEEEVLDKRPVTATKYRNFYLAGDWINTGLPATIEGAVKSARVAADAILTAG
jgi:hydroxysqualene dehydroxylase